MPRKLLLLSLGVLGAAGPFRAALLAYSSDGATLTRTISQNLALTNSPVVVTVTFSNAGVTELRGFCYADQTPSGLTVETYSLAINGLSLTNFAFETGADGDVYAGCTPHRWMLELPPSFAPANRIPARGTVQLVYALNSTVPGTFNLGDYSWIGFRSATTNTLFGHAEIAEHQAVSFVTADTPPTLSGSMSSNRFTITLAGVPGCTYAIEVSTDLTHWAPVTTNLVPFAFQETNSASYVRHFFRARKIH